MKSDYYRGVSGVPGQGPFFRIEFFTVNDTVSSVSYETTSCLWATMTGMSMGRLLERQPISCLGAITEPMLASLLPDLPASNREFLSHAIAALRHALRSGPGSDA